MKIVSNENALVFQLETTGTTVNNKIRFNEELDAEREPTNINIIPALKHAIAEGKPVYIRLRKETESETRVMCYPVIGFENTSIPTIYFVTYSGTALKLGEVV